MAYITTLSPNDLRNHLMMEMRIERSGRLDEFKTPYGKRVFLFALKEYLEERGCNTVPDDPRTRYQYVVTDTDIDTVLSRVSEEFNQ